MMPEGSSNERMSEDVSDLLDAMNDLELVAAMRMAVTEVREQRALLAEDPPLPIAIDFYPSEVVNGDIVVSMPLVAPARFRTRSSWGRQHSFTRSSKIEQLSAITDAYIDEKATQAARRFSDSNAAQRAYTTQESLLLQKRNQLVKEQKLLRKSS